MNLQLFSDPFSNKINLATALTLDNTNYPPKAFLADERSPQKTPLPLELLCIGIKYGIEGGISGRKLTSPLYDEQDIVEGVIDIFEHSFEVPPATANHYQMDTLTAMDFFRAAKYEINVCSYLICYGNGFWLIRLNAFYTDMFNNFLIKKGLDKAEVTNFVFKLQAEPTDQKDGNGSQLWEFDFELKPTPKGLIETLEKDNTYQNLRHFI